VTVLGDLAQATTPWAPGDWAVSLRHLGHPDARLRPLTIGYRVPGEVLVLANRLLPHLEVTGVPAARSVRRGDDALTFAPAAELAATVAGLADIPGSIGVIVPDARVDGVLRDLTAAGLAAERLDADADPRVSVAPASEAKGLEFDSVVLLEPEEIVSAEPTRAAGLRRLYVVLTRAVSRLAVLHDAPLPEELSEDPVATAAAG
jgi:DNA helicase IV